MIPRPNPIIKFGGKKKNDLTKEYNKIVSLLEKNVFHSKSETTDEQLEEAGRDIFGSEFGGVYPEDQKVRFDKNHKYYIFNTDKANQPGTHWISVYVDHPNKQIVVFDTFDRQTSKLVPDLYLDIKYNHMRVRKGAHKVHQKDCEMNCGEKSMAYLVLVSYYGIEKVLDSSF